VKDYALELPGSIDPVFRERIMDAARKAEAFEKRGVSFFPVAEVKARTDSAPCFEEGDSGLGQN
jgi:hypothetical protein